MTRVVLTFGIVVIAFGLRFDAPHAQQTGPVFRDRVDLVHFDVSVLDKNRRPVRGLTAADFTIFEDGKPQTIAAFAAVDVPPPAPEPAAKWLRQVSPDTRTNEPEQNPEGRLFVIFIDDALLPSEPWTIQSAKQIAHGVVDRLSSTDQVAVVFSFASRNAQDFTTDRKKLSKAIDSLQGGGATHFLGWDTATQDPRDITRKKWDVGVDGDIHLQLGALRTLSSVAETLIAAPQRRKSLIYVSPGVAADNESDAQLTKSSTPNREANHQLLQEMPEVFRRMARANVTLYSIDPCGLGGFEAYIASAAAGIPALRAGGDLPLFYNWLAPGGIPPRPGALAHHSATVSLDFLVAAATNTGGRAIVNTNDFDAGLDGLFAENGSYYLLGYIQPAANKPGSLHRVSVKVNRPGVTVRTAGAYEVEARAVPVATDPTTSGLAAAAAGPTASSDLPLQIALTPVALPNDAGGLDSTVTIALGFRQPNVTTRTAQTIDLRVSIYRPDGIGAGDTLRQTATFSLVPGSRDVLRYDVLTQVALKPGRYELRVAAHRATDNVSGSVYADVEVPDFSKAPMSLSGVWLEANPGPSAVPRDAFTSLLPIVPTASREFASGDQVTAFFRLYQGGDGPMSPVPLTVRLVNDHDVVVATASGAVETARFDRSSRSADHRFELPRGLPAGRYLLSFEASLGQTMARRDVVFSVR